MPKIVLNDVPQEILDEVNRVDWSDPKLQNPEKVKNICRQLKSAIGLLRLPTRTLRKV